MTMRAALACAVLLASAPLLFADDPVQYSPWSMPVNLGPTVNSSWTEAGTFISKDGLSLYFSSYRPVGMGGLDLWVAQRASVNEDWGEPKSLGDTINSGENDTTPAISTDGHWLFFASNRPGGSGGLDLYASRRHNKRDDFGWGPPVNLGPAVNTAADDRGPAYFEDDATGAIVLYFSSKRNSGQEDIFSSTLQPDESWGPSAEVAGLANSCYYESNPSISKDGLEIYVGCAAGGPTCPCPGVVVGSADLYVSTRESTADPWSPPVNLGSLVNSTALDFRPSLSFDKTELYFHSGRSGGWGGYALYRSTRTKLQD